MKLCDYCGRENGDEANSCRECGSQEFKKPVPPVTEVVAPSSEIDQSLDPGVMPATKVCSYCGRENEPNATCCRECGTQRFQPPRSESSSVVLKTAPPTRGEREFRKLTPEETKLDLVTLLTCRNLLEADMVVGQLASVGISAFIPDESLMQAVSWNVNAFGYVRVQISPDDYEPATAFLRETPEATRPDVAPDAGAGPND